MEYRDLKAQYMKYRTRIDESIKRVLDDANYISGKEVLSLEKRLAEYVGVKHCITCANGTDALALVLRAWGIGDGDAVFVPDFTFFATAEVVSLVGATPVFIDVDEKTFNMNTDDLEKRINSIINQKVLKPKAIIPVDLFGLLANYDEINKIAKKFDLLVLEDGAQGFGAEYNGQKACSFGDAATTSFFPAKPLGCYGDGGAIFTNDNDLASLLKSLRVHGKGINKYDNVRIGFNSRLDTIQAAVLNVKLDIFIDHELADVNQIYKKYNDKLNNYLITPTIPKGYISSFAQYTVKLKSLQERNGLKEFLEKNGIPCMIYYLKGMHSQTAYKELNYTDKDYPVTTMLSKTVLSLPIHPYLSNDDIDFVTEKIIEYLKKH